MSDLAKRFIQNPLLKPADLEPSNSQLVIVSLLNPGVFVFKNKIWLLVRVAENVKPKEGYISIPKLNANKEIEIKEVSINDPELIIEDVRVVNYQGEDYLTTVSHLRLLCSDNGIDFTEDENYPALFGNGELENFGIEDCRVTQIKETYYLTYTAVSNCGVGVGLRTTKDWRNFEELGMIFPPHNKDCAIFEGKIEGKYYALHRPSSAVIGGSYIWLAESDDGLQWGNHKCLIKTRNNLWDSARVGAGASPIKTKAGWLAIYHGADEHHKYGLGAFLLDLENPSLVLGRTIDSIMQPLEKYEKYGFFGEVVFTNGHIVNGDKLTIYYGAADEVICAADFSISEILNKINKIHSYLA
ncbi:glycoside hydrolase family 130 protein [Pedobacter cryotolerans]|uniref:Glycosidase n=1 Tax=Pedobacter cryotolerans TaxID=2571270 RepID=A0A4U1BXM4_9SPHI|nr:glycoside hydrolase family 130 protein [Pedobacter cryotolerans]TKB97104.1 glycosidase [Pedobacter cryotolerans]